jgi:FtsP/CotA-like multicopper oxidase with cupredoxin domain
MKLIIKTSTLLLLLILVLVGCNNTTMDHSNMDHSNMDHSDIGEHGETKPSKDAEVVETDGKKVITIEAKETHWMYNDESMAMAWTYNGMLPGHEIRVNEGDHVSIKLLNSLPVPTALHMHGLPVPNEMDGVPGVTQNAILPGETFVYEFVADTPGTYWYHSHQNGAYQVDKGLYGALIVESKDEKAYDLDQVIVLDEWSSMGADMEDMNHGDMNHGDHDEEDKDHGDDAGHGSADDHSMSEGTVSHTEMMNEMYDTMIINGKATSAIESIVVEEGQTVKLRFINAGLFTQVISIPGHSYKVTHYDGQEVNQPQLLSDVAIRIAPAERYDLEIMMDQPGAWGIQVFAEQNQDKLKAVIPLTYKGFESNKTKIGNPVSSYLDIASYGEQKEFNFGEITKEYQMVLGSNDGEETFTINNKQMPDHEIFEVVEGDVVKVTIANETNSEHPMHLHGQFFYVLSRNGEPIKGSPIVKDTLNVRPNESYEIVFVADNPGHWMFHCHELHHASGGMVSEVKYKGYVPAFTLDPSIDNQPE